jgi:glycosyltransferase involved in cell wall biosynthesis
MTNIFTQWLGQARLARARPPVPAIARVAVSTAPVFGPWGGGNQWLLQIARFLGYSGYDVRFNLSGEVDCIFIQHNGLTGKMTFGFDEIEAYRRAHPRTRVIHRINDNDIRKGTAEMDALMARYNSLADFTVFISEWLRDHHVSRWFDRARPHACILNGADSSIFHPVGGTTWRGDRPFRLVTHHWADNRMKGFDEYAEIDRLIAAGVLKDVELWVIGRWPKEIVWKSARTFPPRAGPALASLLRQCDAYITASRWEPGGMHFIEGLQCGLPIAFHEDGGGIPELARRYGVPFRSELAEAVENLRKNYAMHRANLLANPPSGEGMCLTYRDIVQRVLAERE